MEDKELDRKEIDHNIPISIPQILKSILCTKCRKSIFVHDSVQQYIIYFILCPECQTPLEAICGTNIIFVFVKAPLHMIFAVVRISNNIKCFYYLVYKHKVFIYVHMTFDNNLIK
jgi:hypothetical protein